MKVQRVFQIIATSLALLALSSASSDAQVGKSCSVFSPCGNGFSCQPLVQKCYNSPRQEGQPCSAGFSCGPNLRCVPSSLKCEKIIPDGVQRDPVIEPDNTAQRDAAAREAARREQERRDQAARDQATRDMLAREQAMRDQAARLQAARDLAAAEQAARDQAAREQADRDAAIQRAADQGARDQQAIRDAQAMNDRAAAIEAARRQSANVPAVTGSSVNVALGKRAVQSSTAFEAGPSRAVDGGVNGDYFAGSVTHTNNTQAEWWMVDLGAVHRIDRIVVHNRTDCCSERLDAIVAVTYAEGMPNDSYTYRARLSRATQTNVDVSARGPVFGRFVYVILNKADHLSLAEVQVFGTPM